MNATTKHTCGGPVFGKRTDGCPRCEELKAGAPARKQPWRERAANRDPLRDKINNARHICTPSCGIVCTWGES